VRQDPRRWKSKFGRWVKRYGVSRLAADLGRSATPITSHAIYEWISGHSAPRPERARAIARLSRGQLCLDDVYHHRERLQLQAAELQCG